jgi:AhpC/TSA family
MRANPVALCATVGLAATLACGGGKGSTPPPAGAMTGGDSSAGQGAGGSTNPDGYPYPSPPGGFGKIARMPPNPGAIIENFTFQGYPNGDPSQGLQQIHMSDYYDPCGKRYKLIHLSVAAVWCTPCNQETDEIVLAKSQFDAQGVVMLQALDDGPSLNIPATRGDLDRWVASHHVNFTEMLDPGLDNLHGFFLAAAVPWNADIDPRTMELLDQSTGLSADGIASEIAPAQALVQGAPGYPIAVSCN